MGPASVQRRSGGGHRPYSCVLGRWVLLWATLFVVLATPSTVDVGAAAIDGVWRPTSCDDVKDGFVLTNISDGVRAVIEGCTIAVDAGSDATKSAVSIAGLGENSSVELIRCNVTATFSTTATSQSNRHGAVRVEAGAVLGDNSSVYIRNTSVSMEERSTGHYGGAVLFDVNISAGDGFHFRVSDGSVLAATCTNECGGLLVVGGAAGATNSTFGDRTRLEIADSTITAAATSTAMCVSLAQRVSFGDRSTVSLTATNANATAQSLAISLYLRNDVRLGAHSGLSVEGSTLAAAVEVSDAFPVLFSVSIAFGDRSQVKLSDSNLTATAESENAIPVSFSDSVTFVQGRVAITGSRLVSASSGNSISCLLQSPLSSVKFAITASTFEFNGGSAQANLAWRPGAIIAQNDVSWDTVSLVVASTSLVAASGSSNKAVFVRWPKTITGVSPQSFDNVTLSSIDANVAQFSIAAGGTIGPQATLCLRDVRAWNGAEISSVPLRFAKPTARECWSNTIDVGASAVDGVWRPTSCDDVKGGVVLTNISDGVRAVIEGCTIAVDAGSDATKSAVSIAGLGANSSVELIGCNVTATFSTTPVSGWSSRRGAVRIEPDSVLGNGSKLLIDSTSVSVEEASNVWGASAVLVDSGITAGDGVDIRVSGGSTLQASCLEACCGFMVIGLASGTTSQTVFGNGTQLTIEDSIVSSRADKYAYSVLLLSKVSFGSNSSLSILRTDVTSRVRILNAFAVYFVGGIEFGAGSRVLIQGSNVTAFSQQSAAYCFYSWVSFGDDCRFDISDSNLTATAAVSQAYAFAAPTMAFASNGALDVSGSRLRSAAQSESAAIVLDRAQSSVAIKITSSILEFDGSGTNAAPPNGAVIFSDGAFTDVSLAVSSVSFVAVSADADGTPAVFIRWPQTITGVSPQSFDNVTFSGDGVAPFSIHEGGEGPGPNTTLCLRDVRWTNGTAIDVGPPEFTAPSPMVCWPPLTVDVGASAIDGVWRPTSCDDVKGGVVLTNISDGVRAVIEGCTIAVDAGSDATKSAVSIAGLGENSSVELIGCSVTATFNTTSTDVTNRHGALHVERNATLGTGSMLLLHGTTVSMEEIGAGGYGCAALLDDGMVAGDGFQFRVSNHAALAATCDTVCFGVYFIGRTAFSHKSVFGRGTQFTFENSTLSAKAKGAAGWASGLNLRSIVLDERSALTVTDCDIVTAAETVNTRGVYLDSSSFRNDSVVSITGSNVSTTAGDRSVFSVFISFTSFESGSAISFAKSSISGSAGTHSVYGVFVYSTNFTNGSALSITECNLTTTAGTKNARTVFLLDSPFRNGSALSITRSNISAVARTDKAYGVFDSTIEGSPTIAIRDSSLASKAASSSAALLFSSLSTTKLTLSSSVLSFNGSAPGAETFPSGAIVTKNGTMWSDVELAVSSSSFVATDAAAAAASFVLWPENITGVSPQSFDNVTFAGDGVAPFSIHEGGAGPGPNTTLCLRDARWSNGTAITAGPPAFSVPTSCGGIVTIDVGASAIDGEWRPTSCDDVKHGVVLTNISDGVRAVIEGCTITVDAGSDATKSAVSIAGLGANSSVELIGCNVTATFSTTSIDESNRHGAVRVEANATLGNGSKLRIDNTSVTMTDTGAGGHGSAVLFDEGISAGDGFQFQAARRSTLTATAARWCFGVYFHKDTHRSVFGRGVQFALDGIAVTTRSDASEAYGLYLRAVILGAHSAIRISESTISSIAKDLRAYSLLFLSAEFGDSSTVSMRGSTFTAETGTHDAYGVYVASYFGHGSDVSVVKCNVTATAGTYRAYNVFLYYAKFGNGSAVSITESNLTATAGTTNARGAYIDAVTFGLGSAVSITGGRLSAVAPRMAYSAEVRSTSPVALLTIDGTELTSAAAVSSAALVLPSLSSSRVTLTSSVLQFNGSAPKEAGSPTGAIVTAATTTWADVRFAVSSSSFIATETAVTKAGPAVTPVTTFILWPKTITGVSPQSFDNVTFSENVKSPFEVHSGGSGPGLGATLCLNEVRWSNGTAIDAGPPEFTVSRSCLASAVDVGVSAVDGVWRPASCDDVKHGVVLTNISDGVRAVIEGCTIAVDAGSDATTSAVSIAGLGENSSVELIGCNVTATFSTTTTSRSNRHGAVRVEAGAVLGDNSMLLFQVTDVLMQETGAGRFGAAVLIDEAVTAGDGFRFRLLNASNVSAACSAYCGGVFVLCHPRPTVFGHRTAFDFQRSVVAVSATGSSAHGVFLDGLATVGDDSAVTFSDTELRASAQSDASALAFGTAAQFGRNFRLSLVRSSAMVYVRAWTARGLYIGGSVAFGERSSVTIAQSRIVATAKTSVAVGVHFNMNARFGPAGALSVADSVVNATVRTFRAMAVALEDGVSLGVGGQLTIDGSTLVSSTQLSDSASLLLQPTMASTSITVAASVLQFNGAAPMGTFAAGAITTGDLASWSGVSLAVSSSTLADTSSGGNDDAAFVLWPQNITSVSPQSFDNVTFSGDGVVPFCIHEGGAGPGPNATLCLRDVRWSNGTAIDAGPAAFTTSLSCQSTIIDVGASAVNGVWRPTSCDDVKAGVVLTNISDGVRAVIEGCTIAVDAGSDATKSAVSIAGLGENSSVELIGCNVTATFNTTGRSQSNRHAAVHVVPHATLGNGSKLLIHSTSVRMVETGVGSHGSAVLFDEGISAGDGFHFRVTNQSALNATSTRWCFGVYFHRDTHRSVSGRGAQIAFDDSSVSAHSKDSDAYGLYLRSVILGDHSDLGITGCNVSATAGSYSAYSVYLSATQFGDGSTVSMTECAISAETTTNDAFGVHVVSTVGTGSDVSIVKCGISAVAGTYRAYSVFLYSTQLGNASAISIAESKLNATAGTSNALAACLESVTFGEGSAVSITGGRFSAIAERKAYSILVFTTSSAASPANITIRGAELASVATFVSAALVLHRLSSSTVTLTSSMLRFNGTAPGESYDPSGAIATTDTTTWSGVQLAVSASTFVAVDTAVTKAGPSPAAHVPSFVLWPKTITGMSPQSFDNVTFSGDGVAPFGIHAGGAGPGPNTTLCLKDVRWSNGTAIAEGPPAFSVPSSCSSIATIDIGASANDGEWRPTSCDDVKHGVVLTNISDGVRAVIEGCTITVDAGSDATKSAVSIAGLGENSSVELIGCNVTATFSTTTTSPSIPHGAVRVEAHATLGNRSILVVQNSSVFMQEAGTGAAGAAILFDDRITAGDKFQFRVSNDSALSVTCEHSCFGVYFLGSTSKLVFGDEAQLTIDRSTVSAQSTGGFAAGVYVSSIAIGVNSTVSVTRCSIHAAAGSYRAYGVGITGSTFGHGAAVSVAQCNITTNTETTNARSLSVYTSSFGNGSVFKVTECSIIATAKNSNARGVFLYSTNFGSRSAVSIQKCVISTRAGLDRAWSVRFHTKPLELVELPAVMIHDTHVVSASPASSAALTLPSMSSTRLTMSSSVLQFNGSAPSMLSNPSGAIVTSGTTVWADAQLAVSSSTFIATDGASAAASFVLWPENITGVSPQSFDNVTFSGDGVAPFSIHQGGAGPGPNTTLCLRDVRWSNGTTITEGPPAFLVSDACQATRTPTVPFTPSVSLQATNTQAPDPPPTKPPRAVPAVATDSARAMEGIGGISGVVSPLVAGMAVRVATSARASECEEPTIDQPPAPWPLVAKPLSFLDFGLSKTSDPAAYEDTSLILANTALFLMSILVVIVTGTVLYYIGGAGPLPGHDLRAAAVARLRPGSSGQAAWVAAIATVQVLGGLLVAVVSVLQVPATAAAVSILGNHALVRTGAPLAIAAVALVVCVALTAAQCALCVLGYRYWVARTADEGSATDRGSGERVMFDEDLNVDVGATTQKEEVPLDPTAGVTNSNTTTATTATTTTTTTTPGTNAKRIGMPRRIVTTALDNGAGWRPSTEGDATSASIAPSAALGFAVWSHIVGDARGPRSTASTASTVPTLNTASEDRARNAIEEPLLAVSATSSSSPKEGEQEGANDTAHGGPLTLVAPWRRVAISGAWWLGLLEPSVSFLSGVATGMARAGFCTVGPWAALVLQFVYVMVLVLTWPIKAPALFVTMVAVQALQLASLASDMGMSLAGMDNEAGGTVEAIADWTALVVAIGLAAVGLLAVAVRFMPHMVACYRRAHTAEPRGEKNHTTGVPGMSGDDPLMLLPPDERCVASDDGSEMALLPHEAPLSAAVSVDDLGVYIDMKDGAFTTEEMRDDGPAHDVDEYQDGAPTLEDPLDTALGTAAGAAESIDAPHEPSDAVHPDDLLLRLLGDGDDTIDIGANEYEKDEVHERKEDGLIDLDDDAEADLHSADVGAPSAAHVEAVTGLLELASGDITVTEPRRLLEAEEQRRRVGRAELTAQEVRADPFLRYTSFADGDGRRAERGQL